MMGCNDVEELSNALCAEADKLPLTEWTALKQLVDGSPDLEKAPSGGYALVGRGLAYTANDLDDATLEVWCHVEKRGTFFDFDHNGEALQEAVGSCNEFCGIDAS